MNKLFLLLAQIFSVISVIIYAIIIFYFGFIVSLMKNDIYSYSMSGIFIFFGLVIALLAFLNLYSVFVFQKAKTNNQMRNNVIGWSIYLLFGSFFVGGLFGLLAALLNEDDSSKINSNELEIKLKKLDKLFDDMLITKEEYELKRKSILDEEI